MVGGDVVAIQTRDVGAGAEEIRRAFGLEPIVDGGSLRMEVEDGAAFVPRLMRELSAPVASVTVSRPRLDDVFLKLTGRGIREEEAGDRDMMRAMAARWSRAGGRR